MTCSCFYFLSDKCSFRSYSLEWVFWILCDFLLAAGRKKKHCMKIGKEICLACPFCIIWSVCMFVWFISGKILLFMGHCVYLSLLICWACFLFLCWWCKSKNKNFHFFTFRLVTFIKLKYDLDPRNRGISKDLYYRHK